MRLFLSYASEQRTIAQAVALSLRGRDHEVFFDDDDLPPGGGYDARIDDAIRRSHAFVFLISPEAVSAGRYTLTELKFAKARWPSPSDRVLPVMVAPTPLTAVPAYLKAVTILEPAGNVAAEVTAAVEKLRRPLLPWPYVAPAVIAVAALLFAAYWMSVDRQGVALEARTAERLSAGMFGDRELYRVPISIRNVGSGAADVSHVRVESDPPDRFDEQRESDEPGKELTSAVIFRTSPASVPGGTHTYETFVYLSPKKNGDRIDRFRLCAIVGGGQECTGWQDWRPAGAPDPAHAFTIPPELASRVVGVAADPAGFILATQTPNALHRLTGAGVTAGSQPLAGEPLVIDGGSLGVFVGVRPARVVKIDSASLKAVAQRELAVPERLAKKFSSVVSTMPASIAQDGTNVFVLTRGDAGDAGLFHLDGVLTSLTMPAYAPDVSFELRDIELSSDAGVVWGTETNTTPASLFRFTTSQYIEYRGHDFDSISCARGMGVIAAGLILPSCSLDLQVVDRPGKTIVVRETRGRLPARAGERDVWSTFRIASIADRLVAAINLTHEPAGAARRSLIVQEVTAGRGRELLQVNDAHVTSSAASGDVLMLVLERKDGRRQAVALRLGEPSGS